MGKPEPTIKTREGQVLRLGPFLAAIQREIIRRKRTDPRFRTEEGNPLSDITSRPLIVPKPINTALEEVTDYLLAEYDKYEKQFPTNTLAKWLDKRSADIVKDAWRKGKPIPREEVKRALAGLYAQAQRERGQGRPVVISSGNRAERRKIKKQTKSEVVKI